MAGDSGGFSLSGAELRAVARFAAACAEEALAIFERERLADGRAREAIEAARAFAEGGERNKWMRDSAWAALRAAGEAREAGQMAASEAARAAMAAAGAGFLHPLRKGSQVKHIVGAAAHAARAMELLAGEAAGTAVLARARRLARRVVVRVLRRYPAAPRGGGRVGELVRQLDEGLRGKGKKV